MLKCLKKRRSRQIISAFLIFTLLVSVMYQGCSGQSSEIQNKKFKKFTEALFCQEVASNTVSLHYTLKEPGEYGIQDPPVTFGYFSTVREQERFPRKIHRQHWSDFLIANCQETIGLLMMY